MDRVKLTDTQLRTLARLRRCDRWAEEDRREGMILLTGVRHKTMDRISDWFDEKIMADLLRCGAVECDASQRIRQEPWRGEASKEITVKYWRVLT